MRVNSDSTEPAWSITVERVRTNVRVVGFLPRVDDVPQDIRDALLKWLQPERQEADGIEAETFCGIENDSGMRCDRTAGHEGLHRAAKWGTHG